MNSALHGPGRAELLALVALNQSIDGRNLISLLTELAPSCGVPDESALFDAAAEFVGLPYCRVLDLYVDPETKAKAEAVPPNQMYLTFRR